MSKPKYNNLISKTTSKLNNSFIISGYLDSDIGGPPYDRDLTTAEALSVLYEEIDKTDFQQIFKGSPNEYISSLVAFPIDILSILKMNFPTEERKPLYIRGNKISRTRRVIQSDETLTVYGFDCSKDLQFYLGYIEYPYSKSNKFYHRNGYTRLQLFLPYLGFVELSPNDFCDPYSHINIILSVDPKSASATYYIYASNSPMYTTTSSTVPRNYYIGNRPVLSTLTRLVAQYAIELGIKIPIGATNATENARNILLGAIKAGAAIASAGTSMAVGAGISTATSTATETVVKKGRAMQTVGRATSEGGKVTKPLTDRLYKAGEKKTTKEGSRTVDSSSYYKGKAVNECFSAFTEGVSSLFSNGSCDRINATSGLYNSPIKPFLQVFVPKIKSDEGYGDIYGKPLGVVRKLSGLRGYTEIAKLHIEGEDFESATREEIGMLGNALSDGVILGQAYDGIKVYGNYWSPKDDMCEYRLNGEEWNLIETEDYMNPITLNKVKRLEIKFNGQAVNVLRIYNSNHDLIRTEDTYYGEIVDVTKYLQNGFYVEAEANLN